MFIQTEDTPNPSTMKFMPGCAVAEVPTEIESADKAANSPLAQRLFAIDGVHSVFLGTDFISVTREGDKQWPSLRPALLTAIMDHFVSGQPVLLESDFSKGDCGCACSCACNDAACGEHTSCDDQEIVRQINELLDLRIRPAVAQDGGDVAFERYEDGIVYLRLKGACAGCPSATATLKFGIEQMLRHFIPEVQEVRRVV